MPVRVDHGQTLASSPASRASIQTPTYDLCLDSIFIFHFLKEKIKAHILSSHTVIPGNHFRVKEFWLLRGKTNTERFPAVLGALPVHGVSTSSCQNCYVATEARLWEQGQGLIDNHSMAAGNQAPRSGSSCLSAEDSLQIQGSSLH